MKSKILVVGFACLAVVAFGQSNENQQQSSKTSQVTAPRDAASGQASGKMSKKASDQTSQSSSATVQSKGGKTAQDDWSQKSAVKTSDPKVKTVSVADVDQDGAADRKSASAGAKGQVRVAAGDVNGDGVADATAKNSGHATEQNSAINNSHSNIKTAREASSGMATGKRQHAPISATKTSDAAPNK